jgi:hypothetical protein
MFKKKIAVLIAAAMMTLSASSAFAAFADLELIRVVYERGAGTETLTDLGNVNTVLASGGTFAGTGALTATTPANLYVAYFAIDGANGQLWASSKTGITEGDLTTATSGWGSMLATYNSNKVGVTHGTTTSGQAYATSLQSDGNAYVKKLSALQGTFSNSFLPVNGIEKSLGSLVNASSGSVSQKLYFWADAYGSYAADPNLANTGVVAATITTSFDGSSTITTPNSATPTPIPPAFFLMGSGLLGMFGLRRKNKVA